MTLRLHRDTNLDLWLTRDDHAAMYLSDEEAKWLHMVIPLVLEEPLPTYEVEERE